MRKTIVLAILVLAVGCESTPEPTVPRGIAVSAKEDGRHFGGRAVYGVHATVEVARQVILDFDSHPDFRPSVIEAAKVAENEEGGEAIVKFRSPDGTEPNATCIYTIGEADGGGVLIDYAMSDPSLPFWSLKGSFKLLPAREGEWTVIHHEFLVALLSTDRAMLMDLVRAEAEAMKQRIEEVAGAVDEGVK